MSKITAELPDKLLAHLRAGAPALLLTTGEDGYANVAYTWAAAPDAGRVRFGADHGSATLANLQRDGRASLQIAAPGNLVFLVKGTARTLKDRIAAAPSDAVRAKIQPLADRLNELLRNFHMNHLDEMEGLRLEITQLAQP